LPIEYAADENSEVYLVDNQGKKIGEGLLERILNKPNKTNVARVRSLTLHGEELIKVRGFIVKENYPEPLEFTPTQDVEKTETYVCHCDDVSLSEIMKTIGNRKFISVDEIKHTTRLGMGACRGKRCIKRLKSTLAGSGIQIVGDATPRGPLSNQIEIGELYPKNVRENIIVNAKSLQQREVKVLIAGGGIGGSALFRYMAEAGLNPVLINYGRGASWRNIAGGRPAFSLPEIADIAIHNLEIFKDLQKIQDINFRQTRYVTFAHDDKTYQALDESKAWSDSYMIEPKDFASEISKQINPDLGSIYQAAHNK
jgi:bacterioferritin-associated ferredoxin